MVDKSLYSRDFNLWVEQMSTAVERQDVDSIDWGNLAVEIECMGDSLKAQLEARVQKLVEHILIIRYCPKLEKANYHKSQATSQQYLIRRILKRNPSLNEFIEREYPEIFNAAIAMTEYLFEVPKNSFIELPEILNLKFPKMNLNNFEGKREWNTQVQSWFFEPEVEEKFDLHSEDHCWGNFTF